MWLARPGTLGWALGAVAFMGMFGGLAHQVVNAIAGNQSLASALNASTASPADGFYSIALTYLALIVIGYVASGFCDRSPRRIDQQDRAPHRRIGAAETRTRLAAHTLVATAGALVVAMSGTLTFTLAAAASLGDAGLIGKLVAGGLAYLPAYVAVVGIAGALFSLQPRFYALMWAVVGATTFIVSGCPVSTSPPGYETSHQSNTSATRPAATWRPSPWSPSLSSALRSSRPRSPASAGATSLIRRPLPACASARRTGGSGSHHSCSRRQPRAAVRTGVTAGATRSRLGFRSAPPPAGPGELARPL